tara:strand:+ start:188 stop:373 length:186 start_codon:yes stop_codon:yes gene_type:complete
MNNCTHLTQKNRTLIIDLIDKEISSIDRFLLQNQNNDNNYNILAYSKALYVASDEDYLILN